MNEKLKILYVDDEPINLFIFSKMASKYYDIKEAESGFKGLEELAKNPDIRVVISDMRMPMMNGIEFITQAKLLYPQIHFYILTGFEMTDDINESLDKGLILKYFQKPFNMLEINKTIEEEMAKGC